MDETEHLWVLHEPEREAVDYIWSVHDPEGAYLGDVSTPRMAVSQIGADFVAGGMSGDWDEPICRRPSIGAGAESLR